jgi:hypothetical protein
MDTLEELAHLYFRLNGFLTIPNYILHDPRGQRGEIDVLGVRLPHKVERVRGHLLEDDPALGLREDKLEMVLVEVGRGKEDFNKPWKRQEVMEYVLRFAGFFEDEQCLANAAARLSEAQAFENDRIRIRPMLCTDAESVIEDEKRRKLQGMLDFVVDRFRKHLGYKADHEQWRGTLAAHIYDLARSRGRKFNLQDLDTGYASYRRAAVRPP